MSKNFKKPQHHEEEEEEEEDEEQEQEDEEEEEQEEEEEEDGDFDFQEKKGNPKSTSKLEKAQVIENNHYDEAVELSDQNSEYKSGDENKQHEDEAPVQEQKRAAAGNQKAAALQKRDESDDEGKKSVKIPGIYDPADYSNLNVSTEITELFKYVTRYKPVQIELDTKLKAFIPDFIPAVGEVDAFLKMSRPDNQSEPLGLSLLDEPTLNQSKKAKLDLIMNEFMKMNKIGKNINVHSIENADKNPREIISWINDVSDLHKNKPPPSVGYSKIMPDIDALMQVWPVEIEDALGNINLPSEEIDLSLADYCKFACSLLDIPVHNTNNNRNLIESLHVFFTLFSEFKENQHFQQQNKHEPYGQGNTMEIN